MAVNENTVTITRWQGSQHPSMSNIIRLMKDNDLRPYMWMNMPNHRYAVRSHNYHKVMYVIDGNVEVTLPDSNQRITLKAGDRIDIPKGTRHGTIIGRSGAKCVEASVKTRRRRQRTSS